MMAINLLVIVIIVKPGHIHRVSETVCVCVYTNDQYIALLGNTFCTLCSYVGSLFTFLCSQIRVGKSRLRSMME